MRIDPNFGLQQAPETNRNSASAAAVTTAGTGLGQDQAQLSGGHAQVAALAAQAAQLPEVREERVHALRQAVESGQYGPSPETVAGALLIHMTADSFA